MVRRKWAAAVAALAVLGALGAAAAGITIGEPSAAALGTSSAPAQALRALEQAGVPVGVLNPVEVLVPASGNPARLARQLAALSFGWGQCTMQASPGILTLRAEADDEGNLRRVQDVVARHLARFGRRDQLTVNWQRPQSPGGAGPERQPETLP